MGIFVMGMTGESVRRLTTSWFAPGWSPDGNTIVYCLASDTFPHARGNMDGGLRVVDVAGGEPREIYKGDALRPRYSPDGRRIAFWSGRGEIWTIPADGGESVRLVDDGARNSSPVWSSDGRAIHYLSDRGGTTNLWRIAVDQQSGSAVGPSEPQLVPTTYIESLALSADDRQMMFTAWERKTKIMAVDFDEVTGRLAGVPEVVIESFLELDDPSPSPDGKTLLMRSGYPVDELFTLDLARKTTTRLTYDEFVDRHPSWAPDGRTLVFHSNRLGEFANFSMNPDGSGVTPLFSKKDSETGFSRGDSWPVWSPDGSRYATGGSAQGRLHERDSEGNFSARELPPLDEPGTFFFPSAWFSDGARLLGLVRTTASGTHRGVGMAILKLDSGRYAMVSKSRAGWTPRLSKNERWAFVSNWFPAAVVAVDLQTGDTRELVREENAEGRRVAYCKATRRIYYTVAPWESNIWLATIGN